MIISEAARISNIEEYYFLRKLKEISELEKTGARVINLGIGNPDLPPSMATINALIESAKCPNNHGYQSYRSIPELRRTISDFCTKTYKTSLDPEGEILPLTGSKEGIAYISLAFLNPGDEVLIPNPGYPTYSLVNRMVGTKIKYYDLEENKNWQINIEQLKRADLSKVKIMWINYPNMPTGKIAAPGLFKELIDLASENNFLLCHDNPYSLVLNENPVSILSLVGAENVCIELNSLSKSHNMAGWRIGWVAGNSQYINSVQKVKSYIDTGMFLPVQHAAIEALRNPDKWHLDRNLELYKRRSKVFQLLDQLGCFYDEDQVGMFVWAKIPDSVSDVENYVDEILYQANIFVAPGVIFGSNGNRHIRVSLCSNEQNLDEAIRRIKSMLKNSEVG